MQYLEPYLHPAVRGIGSRHSASAARTYGAEAASQTSAADEIAKQRSQQQLLLLPHGDEQGLRLALQRLRHAVGTSSSGGNMLRTQKEEMGAVTAAGFRAILSSGWWEGVAGCCRQVLPH